MGRRVHNQMILTLPDGVLACRGYKLRLRRLLRASPSLSRSLATPASNARQRLFQVAASVGQGGDALVEMVTEASLQEGAGGRFLATEPGKPDSPFATQAVSVEAQDVSKGQRLWELSAACVGLGQQTPI